MSSCTRSCSFLILLQALALLEAKVQKGTLKFAGEIGDSDNWQFMSKFGFGLGTSSYMVRYRLPNLIQGQLSGKADIALIMDDEWAAAQREHELGCSAPDHNARSMQAIDFALGGEWSAWQTGTVAQSVRPHIWYFITSICNQDFSALPLHVEYELVTKQADGSQFSIEMQWMMSLNFVVLVCLLAFLSHYCYRCQAFAKSAGSLHPVICFLSAAIFLQFAAQALHTLHLWNYQSSGVGIMFLDWLSEVFFMLSQVVQTTLLIAIAMGYTLLPSRNDSMAVVKLIALTSLFLHTVLVSFAKMQDDSSSKYHENEGLVGWVLLSVRLMLFAWFIFAVKESRRVGGLQVQDFLKRFSFAGSVYFLAYPILFVLVQFFAAYLRHPILQLGLIAMQSSSSVCLAQVFLSRGTYFKVSSLSSSLLPSFGKMS